MTPDEALKFMKDHHIQGALLKEFVLKGLWSAALQSLDMTVKDREKELQRLAEFRTLIQEEMKGC